MTVKKVVVDQLPEDCITCPLKNEYRKDCGKAYGNNHNGGVVFGNKPDERCKLGEYNEKESKNYKGTI